MRLIQASSLRLTYRCLSRQSYRVRSAGLLAFRNRRTMSDSTQDGHGMFSLKEKSRYLLEQLLRVHSSYGR